MIKNNHFILFDFIRILKYKPPENVADEFRKGLVQGDKQVTNSQLRIQIDRKRMLLMNLERVWSKGINRLLSVS